MNFVDLNVVCKKRDDKGNSKDNPMPEAKPESCHISSRISYALCGVRAGGTADQEQRDKNHKAQQERLFHPLFSF